MVAGFGKRYRIYMPDGSVEHRTMLGDAKLEGETLRLRGRNWEVVRLTKLMAEETDYELHVRPLEE